MKKLGLVLLVAACHEPLKPGETECKTTNVFGVLRTRCETGQEPAPAPAPVPAQVQGAPVAVAPQSVDPLDSHPDQVATNVTGEPWWCTSGSNERSDIASQCYVDEADCNRLGQIFASKGYAMLRCFRQATAACMHQRERLTNKVVRACFPMISDCHRWLRDVLRYNREDLEIDRGCGPVTRRSAAVGDPADERE